METSKQRNEAILLDASEKSHKMSRELEKLAEQHADSLLHIGELKEQIKQLESTKNEFQKKLTKEVILIRFYFFKNHY